MDSRLSLLEALYRFDVDEFTHVRLIVEAAARYWQRQGPVLLMTARLGNLGRVEMSPLQVTRDDGRDYACILGDVLEHISDDELVACLSVSPVYGRAFESETGGALKTSTTQRYPRWGFRDMLGCYSATREGCLIGLVTPRDELARTSARERDHWQPIAAHLASAWRLRQRLTAGAAVGDLADATLLPDGRCLAEGSRPVPGPVRGLLRDLVRQREHERGARVSSSAIWPDVVAGRWTLIDHYEASGRRVVLAVRNTPVGESLCRLTRRELAVLEQARRGAANKEIALDLNISESAVTRTLQSASRKLNAAAADLLQFFAADTMRCRRLLAGEPGVIAWVEEATGAWQALLSEAETCVVAGVLRGCSNREIAAARGRSIRTVVNQLASAFEKLGVRSRRELVSRIAGASAPAA